MVSSFPFFLLLDVLGNYADSLFVVSYITAPNRVIMLSFGTDEEYISKALSIRFGDLLLFLNTIIEIKIKNVEYRSRTSG